MKPNQKRNISKPQKEHNPIAPNTILNKWRENQIKLKVTLMDGSSLIGYMHYIGLYEVTFQEVNDEPFILHKHSIMLIKRYIEKDALKKFTQSP